MLTLDTLRFDNTYAELPDAFYQTVFPTPLQGARLAAFSPEAAALIDLDPKEATRREFAEQLVGARTWPGIWPLAQVYAGHQFGSFVPQLGDGRAILLGEACAERPHVWNRYRNLSGRKWDLHLKGSGPTAYSRQFDGRAVLRSCLREFLVSEAMEALGIPTARALAVVASDEPVFREKAEPGAMLLRLSPSHIRFGTFEYFYFSKRYAELKELADFTLHQYFPHLESHATPYAAFFREVVGRTAELIAHWQSVGFTHGVMNTDNFSILGLTMDYGPYGFLDEFNPSYVSNHSDPGGVYAFGNQPQVGFFNIQCLMRALSPLLTREQADEALADYEPALARCYLGLMADKLGLLTRRDEDEVLLHDLLGLLPGTDYTLFFRRLAGLQAEGCGEVDTSWLSDISPDPLAFQAWLGRYRQRLQAEGSDDLKRRAHMNSLNPAHVLRNYLAQQAIVAASQGDYGETERLRRALLNPFLETPETVSYGKPSPEWGRKLVISCSS